MNRIGGASKSQPEQEIFHKVHFIVQLHASDFHQIVCSENNLGLGRWKDGTMALPDCQFAAAPLISFTLCHKLSPLSCGAVNMQDGSSGGGKGGMRVEQMKIEEKHKKN